MGSEQEEPWINKFTRNIQQKPPADITPFLSAIQSKFGEYEKQIETNTATEQAKSMQLLRNALTNAVGSLQYNPYATGISRAYEKIKQQKIQPLEQSKSQAISQYSAVTPEVSQALRMTGAYEWAEGMAKKYPELAKMSGGVKDVLNLYKPAYESGMQFLDQTKSFLKGLGYEDADIESAIKPYSSLVQEGYELPDWRG